MITEEKTTVSGKTHVFVKETNDSGEEVCFGCKERIDTLKNYTFTEREGEDTLKHYTVHKYCGIVGRSR